MKEIKFSPLRIIPNLNGNIMHGLKSSDEDFIEFGEAYFSIICFRKIKGWKMHRKMDMNLLVPSGDIKFHLYDKEGRYQSIRINKENYGRLFVPAGCWMAFEGKGEGDNILLNIASIEHDPNESISKDLNELEVK